MPGGRPPGPIEVLTCPNCKNTFSAPVWEKRKFCCLQCSVDYNKEKVLAVLNSCRDRAGRKKIPRKQILCPTCGRTFEIRITEIRVFCSLRCRRRSEEVKAGQHLKMCQHWQDPEYLEMMKAAWGISPNKPETFLQDFLAMFCFRSPEGAFQVLWLSDYDHLG